MRKSTLLAIFVMAVFFLSFHQVGWGQVILYEDFNYTTPAYVGGNGAAGTSSNNWTTHSVTSGQTTTIDINDNSLNYTGLASSSGNKVYLFSNANATSRDINRAFSSSATALYYSVLVNVIDNTQISSANPDYFMCFGQTAGTTVAVLGGRLGIKSVNAGANYRLSIQNISSGTPTYTEFATDLSFGTTYLIVVKYDYSTTNDIAYLWVNPSSLGSTEPGGSVSNNSGTAVTFNAFASICLRNSATTPKAYVDEIRVGATWADVTPIPSTPTLTVAPATLSGFTYVAGSGPSAEQSFVVSGSSLSSNISITPATDYEISTTTGALFVATNPVTLTQVSGSVAGTTIYTRLKSSLNAGSYNLENIAIASTGATNKTVTCSGTVTPQLDWANLQWPNTGYITLGNPYGVYARVYEPGITDAPGQGAGITCWIGYSTSNTDPSTWTNWVPATYNLDAGNNDEYMANLGLDILSYGSYYYASRFQLGTAPFVYGGYSAGGGGFWNGTTNVSGTLIVDPAPQIDWANLQWPANGTVSNGGAYNVYAQVYEPGVTDATGQGAGITSWIGYSNGNSNPNTWTNWVAASYSSDQGSNDEYMADLGAAITTPGIYYYASRFQMGLADYVYGGFNGGFWNGTTNVSGILSVAPAWTSGWPKAENATPAGFTAKANLGNDGTTYFVVLPSAAAAPSSIQVKTGQNAAGTTLASNLRGSILCFFANTEYTALVSGLSGSTTYDVYFVVEGQVLNLQAAPVKVSVTTTASGTAPVVSLPTAVTITNNSALLGGTITSDGGNAITERGTVWKTSAGVTITDNKLAEGGTATGLFTQTRTALPAKTKIYYAAYATNGIGTSLSSEASFYTLANEPTTHVAGFAATAASSTGINLSWTSASAGADGYLILQKAGAVAPTGTPSDATAYTTGNTIGDGTVAAIITPGSALAAAISGLTASTQYSFTIIPFASDGVNAPTYNYNTNAVIPSATATTNAPAGSVYTWQGANNAAWNVATNWNPTRTTPSIIDVLQFSDGTTETVTAVPTETIGQLVFSNNTVVNLQSAAAVTLTIAGLTGTDLVIPSGCALNLNALNAITINLPTGSSGSVSGSIAFSSTASTAHRLTAVDASAITFNNGASFTAGSFFNGNAFGAVNLNSIIFASGSTYISQSGSNPFGATQPASVVVFQTGSLYKIMANLTPSLSGRTYANMEVNFVGASLSATGGVATSIDNLTITNGTLNFNMTGTTGHSIKGNISVASGGVLNFVPATAGTVNLNGTSTQTISNAGTLSFASFSTIVANNAAGIVLSSPVTMNNLTLTNGIITTGANTLTVNGTLTGGSATAYVSGKLARLYSTMASKDFPIGKGGNYRPVTLNYTAVDSPSTVTAEQTESALSGTLPANTTLFTNRYWTLTQTGATVFSYTVTLDGTGFAPAATPVILKNDAGVITSYSTSGTPPAYTSPSLNNFSDFALGDLAATPVITSTPATLTGFTYIQGSGPSAEKTFTVSGANLSGNISIAASTNYQISTTTGAGFTSPLTLAPTSGTVGNTTIYVRLKAGLTAGAYNGEVINITSTGATANTVTCSGTVTNPTLSVGTLSSFGNVCIGSTAGPSTFTITGTDLTAGSLIVGALSGYTYSATSGGTYFSTLSFPEAGGAYSTTVYVKFNPILIQSYNGNIPVSGGGASSVNCTATGSGINTPPAVTTTSPATLVTGISATCSGNVTDGGCATVTARGICYGTSVNPDITGTKTTETGTTGVFSSNLTGLVPATTYHFRAYATSTVSTTYGSDFTFTTLLVAPTVITNAATLVNGTGATLNGSVNANNSSTAVTFQYGTTIAYGSTVSATPATVTGTTTTGVLYLLSGLIPNTTYHFRAVGVNAGGTTNGNDLTFTTSTVVPTVITTAASSVTSASATLNGTVNANNASTAVTFEYGTTVSYGTAVTATPSPVTGTSVTSVSYALSGLAPNTTYHFRVVGVNTAGTANGNDMTFTTTSLAPTAVTTAATLVGAATATLNGTVNANNQNATVTFQYGLTIAYGSTVNAVPNTVTGNTNTAVSAALTGLALNSTYHFRVVAVNATGTTNGNDLTFSTNCIFPDPAGTITGTSSVCQSTSGVAYNVGVINQAVSYVWTVPAGASIVGGSGTNSILVDFGATAVAGNITVLGTNACGNGTASSFAVNVNARPLPVISGSATACVTATNNVYTTQAGMTAYNWSVSAGGVISAGAGTNAIIVTWNTLGTKTITVNYAGAGGCSALAPATFTVTVNSIPSPGITGASELCAGSTGVVYTTEAGFSNYVWTISYGGSITSGINSNEVTVSWATAGSRTISVNYSNASGCPATLPASHAVSVLSVPVPLISGENQVCEGSTGVTYTTQSNNTAYVWTVSSGGTITAGAGTDAITVNWTGNGNQTVSVNYANSLGCGAIAPTVYMVSVAPKPAAAGTVTGTSPVCAGTNGVVYTVQAIANATSYTWTVPAGASIVTGSATNAITVNFALSASPGIIRVNGVNDCGSGAASPNFSVVVNPIPATPVITQHLDTLSSSANTGNQWYLNGVIIPGATAKKHIAVYTGTYTVVVTLTGCSSASSNAILVLPVSVGDFEVSHSFDVYPNPSHGQFNIRVTSAKPVELNIEIFNSVGIQIWKQEKVSVDGTYITPVSLDAVPNGVYMVALRNMNTNIVRKVVIMK